MPPPRVLLVGHGAREAALARSIVKEGKLWCLAKIQNPAFMADGIVLLPASDYSPRAILGCAREVRPDFVMIGPEVPISEGVADELEAEGFFVCAPSKSAARLEGDKVFMRGFVAAHLPEFNIPHEIIASEDRLDAYFRHDRPPVAVKPVGLTGGKGVKVEGVNLGSRAAAIDYARSLLKEGRGVVLLEERVEGIEFNLHGLTDGENVAFFRTTYDYSYREPGDKGLQTGGMGSYCDARPPLPFMDDADYEACKAALVRTLEAFKAEGVAYRGLIQGQFFLTASGPKICEFSCRFGDPEAINLLSLLEESWTRIMEAMRRRALSQDLLASRNAASVAMCLAPVGYPAETGSGRRFEIDTAILQGYSVEFVPGSCEASERVFVTQGGRAGALLSNRPTLTEARAAAVGALSGVKGLEYRADVADGAEIAGKVEAALRLRRKLSG